MKVLFIFIPIIFCLACVNKETGFQLIFVIPKLNNITFTPSSPNKDTTGNFNTSQAINKIASIENEYFNAYCSNKLSKYYGTIWRESAESELNINTTQTKYETYVTELNQQPDSMHCTIYAVEALKAGMGKNFNQLVKAHKEIWNNREFAGWSLGYLLVRDWNWEAYLILDEGCKEFNQCVSSFHLNKTYPVWKQPNIPLKAMYIRGKDNHEINQILRNNEFGWGFSNQGIHTWITRFQQLKECNWMGAPGIKFTYLEDAHLFKSTPFLEYYKYASHIFIFPPKK